MTTTTLILAAAYTLAALFTGYALRHPSRRGTHTCPTPDEDPRKSGGIDTTQAPGQINKPDKN